jgi:hypothetical protein
MTCHWQADHKPLHHRCPCRQLRERDTRSREPAGHHHKAITISSHAAVYVFGV